MHTTTTAVTWSCRDTRRLFLGLGRGLPLLRCPACKLQHCHDDQGKIPSSLWILLPAGRPCMHYSQKFKWQEEVGQYLREAT